MRACTRTHIHSYTHTRTLTLAHLALSLERLDELLDAPAQRVGLSATVRPHSEVARFLAGERPVTVVAPRSDKSFELSVRVPVEDMTDLSSAAPDVSAPAGTPGQGSIWPHVERQVVDLVTAHRSTIVFVNSRRLAERLTTRLNEIYLERVEDAIMTQRELLTSILQANLAVISVQQNDVVKKISGWAAIITVPTFIASFYGMNFDHMPELGWALAYPGVIVLMIAAALALLGTLKRAHWL